LFGFFDPKKGERLIPGGITISLSTIARAVKEVKEREKSERTMRLFENGELEVA
jgi:hypothetical protein